VLESSGTFNPWGGEEPSEEKEATKSHFFNFDDDAPGDFVLESDPAYESEPVELPVGGVFAGLEIRGRLGSGGMAVVYRARDPELETEVALKLLNRGLVAEPRHLERFRQEARLAARLRHQRIVTIHRYGEEEGCAYLTMQLVEGPTLHEVVQLQGPLEPERAARIVEQIALAIDAAHAQRVVHRDLKPSNVMIHPSEGPLVLDFGLAKELGGDPTLTASGEILGTPAFLAPEQAMPEGVPVDHRIDVYGLGGILFYLLCARNPHLGETPIEVVRHILDHDPPPLRKLDPGIPRELEAVCLKAMARDPRDRYQRAEDLAEDLRRYLGQEPILARPPGLAQRTLRRLRKHPLTTSLGCLLLISLLIGAWGTRSLARKLALQQRSQHGLELLDQAQAEVRAGLPAADQTFLQAMLVTKSAFLEDPEDEALRRALMRVKRERAEYAEARGSWALAEELRLNLARLAGEDPPNAPNAPTKALIRVQGLAAGESVEFLAWHGNEPLRVANAEPGAAEVELQAGEFLALHKGSRDRTRGSYLLVVDAGHVHELRLDSPAPPPPGVFRLPPGVVPTRPELR
jgi:serine/threonine protein kinase